MKNHKTLFILFSVFIISLFSFSYTSFSQDAGAVPQEPVSAVPESPDEPAVSDIEKIMSGRFPTEISRELRQFGYDYFKKPVSTFAPITNLPVGPDYIIGPGDTFTIHIWGKIENSYDVTVSRDGRITLPRLGTLDVSGLSYGELKSFLFNRLKDYYTDFELSVTMGTLRSMEIFIVGEALNPGTYSVSSLSTVINALFAAGGPSKKGSLRNIRLFRNGEPAGSLDLYDFFIKGLKNGDTRLQPGDTVFIPVIGPVAGISGSVKRPAIYEMKTEQSLGALIELAGGVLPAGYLQNVAIERTEGHQRRVVKSFNLDPASRDASGNLKTELGDGDLVKIYPVHDKIRQVVFLDGHVKYPREYELKPGMKIRDLIPSYESLLDEPYLPLAEIRRLMPPDFHPEIVQFNLGSLMEGDERQNLSLQDRDRITVYDRWEKRDRPEVSVSGAVRNPGTYRLYEGMTLNDLIFQAGNLSDDAYMEKADLTRLVAGEQGAGILKLSVSLKNALAGSSEDNLLLQKNDFIQIRKIPEYGKTMNRRVTLEGEFMFPGTYSFEQGERLSSVIERAGGLTEQAYPFGAAFQREDVKRLQTERMRDYIEKLEQDVLTLSIQSTETALDKDEKDILQQTLTAKQALLEKMKAAQVSGRMVIDLRTLLVLPSSDYDLELKPGDRLIVNARPDYVNIIGEVYNSTALFYEKDRNIGYYLGQVGGMTRDADKNQTYVVRADGSVISRGQEGFLGLVSWDTENQRWSLGGFKRIALYPGDTIVVPKKIVEYPWLRITKEITQVMYQIAVTAGVIIVAF